MTKEKVHYGPAIHIEGGRVDPAGVEAVAKVIRDILSAPHADEATKVKALEVLTSHAVVRNIQIQDSTFNQGACGWVDGPQQSAIRAADAPDEETE